MALTKLQSFNLDTTANFTFANITATNANLGNAVTANYFIGNGSLLTGIDSANANYSNYAGTIVNSSQPNITAVGTLANLTSNGVVNFTNTSNVTLGAVANLHIAGGSNGQILATDGAGVLSWIPQTSFAPAYVSNGTSNVSVSSVNGNVTITVGGVANVLLATTTGIVVKGNVDVGANYIKGNGFYLTDIDAGTANIANSLVSGTSAVKAQPNGNVYINVAGTSNTVVFTSTGVNIAGYANITGNVNAPYFIGNGAFLTGVDTSPANISNGNSNVSVATANGNVTIASAGNTVVTVTGSAVNVAGNVNATYFVGNGAFLTGVDTSPANISNGTSNVSIPAGSGNITMGVGGSANIVKVTTLGVNVAGNVNATYFVGNGAYLTGVDTSPANIGNGTAVVQSFAAAYIPNTSPAQYTDPAVTVSVGGISNIVRVRTTNSYDGNGVLTATTPSMTIGSNVTVTGNVNATYFVGNGAFLTGVDTSPANISNGTSKVQVLTSSNVVTTVNNTNTLVVTQTGVNVAGYANVTGNVNATYFVGNGAFLTGVDTSPSNISNGTSNVSIGASSGNVTVGVGGVANVLKVTTLGVNVAGNVNATYFVGNGAFLTGVDTSPANISNGTSNVQVTSSGNVTVGVAGNSNVMTVTSSSVNVAGNVNATYFVGNGAFLTGVDVTPSSMSNGNSNVSIATSGGNVVTSVNGTGSVLIVTKTGANVTGYANITGNVSAPYFIGNGAFLTGVDTSPQNISNGTSNVNISTSGGNITMAVAGNVGIVTVTGIGANVDGHVTATGNVTGSFIKGNGYYLTGLQTTGTTISNGSSNINLPATNGNITMGVSGNANVVVVTGTGIDIAGNSNITGQYISTVAQGTAPLEVTSTTQVANLNSATAGTVRTNSQPNITSVGTLTGLTVNGTSNLGDVSNVKIAGGTISYVLSTDGAGNLSWAAPGGGATAASISNGTSNVRAFLNGNVTVSSAGNANVVTVTGSAVNVAGNVNATYFVGNGAFLTGVDVSPNSMSSGNSNVNIPTAGGNVNTSVNGTANVLVVAKTGANIAGYANITGNVSAPFFIGNGSLLTGIGTLSNGTSNIFIVSAGGNITTSVNGNANVMVVTGTGANVAGYVNATGNVNGSNIIASGQFISTASQGTAPLQVVSTTQVANLNAAMAATVSTNAQPNITSLGTLTGLAVSNASGEVNFTTTANVTLGYVGNLHITGGSANYVLKTDGAGNLSWTAQGGGGGGGSGTSITNGTSNVNAELSGNVTVTSAGNTIMTVTDTGANINGYANITGNVALSGANVSLGNVGNLYIAGGANNYILKTDGAGNLAWVAQGSGGGSGVGAIEEFVATAGQTTFTITGGYNVGSAIVFVNGIQMNNIDYTATNGTSIILAEARVAGDIVRVLSSMVSPAININNIKAYSLAVSIAMGM